MNKICTTIEQSQKLIELGINVNTADMMWDDWSLIDGGWQLSVGYYPEIEKDYGRKCYPAWSLTALLNILPDYTLQANVDRTVFVVCESKKPMISDSYDNPIDACYEMILRLHEQKLL